MTMYFIMRSAPSSDEVQGYMEIEDWDDIDGFEGWRHGALSDQRPAGPVQIAAVPHDGYIGRPNDFSDMSVPLISARLKRAIESAGVDNINLFPVSLRNSQTNELYDYYAFNLLGLISATDFTKSKITSDDGSYVGDSEILDLKIDESKCHSLLMFRLKEKFSAILVHEKVKEAIELAGVDTLEFVKPEDFMML